MSYRKVELALGQLWREFKHVNRFRQALKSPRAAQESKLMAIVRANEKTSFGKKHGFSKIASLRDFQKAVPVSTYEDLLPYIEATMKGRRGQLTEEDPVMFATTSGTTGKPKYLPITPTHLRDYAHAFQVHNYSLIKDFRHEARGSFLIFSSNDEEGFTEAGIPYGAVSGLLRRRQSPLVQKYFTLPHMVSKIKDVEVKYYTMLRLALCQDVTAILGCNPSTFLLFADQLEEHAGELIADIFDGGLRKAYSPPPNIINQLHPYLKPDPRRSRELEKILRACGKLTPRAAWPGLGALSCWKGGPLSFYLDRLSQRYDNLPIRDFGYMASEGRGTIPLTNEGAGGVVAVTCHFFEFVKEGEMDKSSPAYLTADELEMGQRYYIHFTTAAGLYRYNINDLIEVVGFEEMTPIIQFVQKGMGVSSVTGEKLTEEQVQVALCYAVRQLQLTAIDHFTFAVRLGHPPSYVCFIELKQELPESVEREFLRVFEQSLQLQNIEYKDKRLTKRLGPPSIQRVPSGTFTKLRQQRVLQGAPEAQVKIPLLTASHNFQDTLAAL